MNSLKTVFIVVAYLSFVFAALGAISNTEFTGSYRVYRAWRSALEIANFALLLFAIARFIASVKQKNGNSFWLAYFVASGISFLFYAMDLVHIEELTRFFASYIPVKSQPNPTPVVDSLGGILALALNPVLSVFAGLVATFPTESTCPDS
ncbi:MAG: hypothetical protein AAGA30_17030 [Planctomycetota bacterium]